MNIKLHDVVWWGGRKWFFGGTVDFGGARIVDKDGGFLRVVKKNLKPVVRAYAVIDNE